MPTFDLAPIDESTPSTSANNNGIPSMLFRWQRNKIQLCAKNKRNSASSVNVDEAQDGIADQSILNGSDNDDVELNGLIEDALDAAPHDISPLILGTTNGEIHNDEYNTVGEDTIEKVIDEVEKRHDMEMMRMAIGMAASSGGERGSHGPFPRPVCGAVLVAKDGRVSIVSSCYPLSLSCNIACIGRMNFIFFMYSSSFPRSTTLTSIINDF